MIPGRARRAAQWTAAVLLPVFLAAGPGGAQAPARAEPLAEPLTLSARPVALEPGAPERTRVGALEWRGGLELASPDPRFGGLSGLLVAPDGAAITALSDAGFVIVARLSYDGRGQLSDARGVSIAPLVGLDGAPLSGRRERDAESLARPSDGSIMVAFEHNHRLWRYPRGPDPLAGRPTPLPLPADFSPGRNSGIEALSELADGALFALEEGAQSAQESPAYLWRDGLWSRLDYARAEGFRPTAASTLPDGDVLVVERRFTVLEGVAIRLTRVPAGAIRPGARLEPEPVALLEPPLALDNIEGAAARRGEAGETLVYLVSDDNFNAGQRTLLLVFALEQ